MINFRRDAEKQARSAFFGRKQQSAAATERLLRNRTRVLQAWAQKHRPRCFPLALEDFSVAAFNRLLRFLGRGLERCRFANLLHANDEARPPLEGERVAGFSPANGTARVACDE